MCDERIIREMVNDAVRTTLSEMFSEFENKIHGHTSARYVMGSGTKGEYLKCENLEGRNACYSYNNGHKIDIDCGTAASRFIALYCLDDGKVYGFNGRSDEL